MRILFIGDIVGRSGRTILLDRLPKLIAEWKLDLAIVNGENAAGGFGITEAIYEEFIDAGADAVTLGNHAWDQREALVFIERVHENAAHDIEHQHAGAVASLADGDAAARRAGRKIDRPDHARLPFDEDQGLALVPGVVAERDDVRAGVQDVVGNRLGDAEAARRVLAIDHDEVEPPAFAQGGKLLRDHIAAWSADDIAEEKETH